MTEEVLQCPECNAAWRDDQTCEEHFHQMLDWENENSVNWEVHHLTVLNYYLQHSSLYSPEGLQYALNLLVDFVERGVTTVESRANSRDQVRSDKRKWNVAGRPGSVGAYAHPVAWTMTAGDVVAAGEPHYRERVRAWAASILTALRVSKNLPSEL